MFFRRALAAQRDARVKEVMAQTKSMQSTVTVGRKALEVRLTRPRATGTRLALMPTKQQQETHTGRLYFQDIQTYETNMKRSKMRMSVSVMSNQTLTTSKTFSQNISVFSASVKKLSFDFHLIRLTQESMVRCCTMPVLLWKMYLIVL